MIRKIFSLLLLVLLMTPFMALANSHSDEGSPFDGVGDIFGSILDIGRLDFLYDDDLVDLNPDNKFVGFVRILMAIMVFALIYLGLSMIPHMSRNISIVIASCLTVLTAVFFPAEVLMAFGETYAVIFALIIIGGPIMGILALCFLTPTPRWPHALLKFLAVCGVMWLIHKISLWAQILSGVLSGGGVN